MNSQTGIMPTEAAAVKSALKQRLITVGFFVATGIAMAGWVSALGWAAIAVAKWLLA
jgi:hypothetical protein